MKNKILKFKINYICKSEENIEATETPVEQQETATESKCFFVYRNYKKILNKYSKIYNQIRS